MVNALGSTTVLGIQHHLEQRENGGSQFFALRALLFLFLPVASKYLLFSYAFATVAPQRMHRLPSYPAALFTFKGGIRKLFRTFFI